MKEWFEIRGAALSDKTTAEWLAIFQAADIAAMPCHTIATLRSDPHLETVGLLTREYHPTEGVVSAIRSTIRSDNAYPPPGEQAQPRGWETKKVLEEIGFDQADIENLLASGAALT